MKTTNFDLRHGIAIAVCLAAVTMFCACGGNASKKKAADGATETEQTETKAATGKGNDYSDAKAFSVKYVVGGDTYIVTRTIDNKSRRLDHIAADGTHEIHIATTNAAGEGSGLSYTNGNWQDVLNAIQHVESFTPWKSLHLYYKDAGFTKSGNVAVAGADCVLWKGTQMDKGVRYNDLPAGKPAEIAVWNNKVTMRLKSDGKIIMEATAFTVDVPDTAFTRTVETTWIK